MFHFFKKKNNSDEKKLVFANFVRGAWQALVEMNELAPDDWSNCKTSQISAFWFETVRRWSLSVLWLTYVIAAFLLPLMCIDWRLGV